ncbi:HAMP domain-containing protein [Arachnia propionica]|uniref:histidine kinase n=1 Tax=Arachnia propionica TaxID=1750 RepID=A0A3P1T2Q3_9ACTN|nr:ATP-binding protein [Arachnia propionica]RRD03548.1 HAMP domain-containing protein [Arachnia propionica]
MFRTVRARIVVLTALVVVTSVVLTAVVVSLAVQRAARQEAVQTLNHDAIIFQSLLEHGIQHSSWADVGPLVERLATQYDRRIALKSPAGQLIVDSDELLGRQPAPLRPDPEGIINPKDPAVFPIDYDLADDAPVELTEEDRRVHAERVQASLACLDSHRIPHETVLQETGLTDVLLSEEAGLSDTQWDQAADCLTPLDLPLPSEEQTWNIDQEALNRCMRERGITEPAPTSPGGSTQQVSRAWLDCVNQQTHPKVAPAVQLFLGSEGHDPLSLEGLATFETTGIVGCIIVVAGIAVMVLSTRIARPLRTLTSAATRLGRGELDVRVEVPDRTEVGTLAETFNSMAESLSRSEQARRQMTADIAHELRNPLVTLGGGLEAIQDGIYEPTPEVIGSLMEETTHLRRLVTDLRELALADTGRLTVERLPLDLADVVSAVATAHIPVAAKVGVTLEATAAPDHWVDGDDTRLRQVISNLLGNAIHHTPDGGTVSLRLGRTAEGITLAITDTGEGIPAEQLPHIFERFWRADPSRHRVAGRTGLGLAISEALVKAHDGTITVASTVGEGTTFTITLPESLTPEEVP